MTCIQDLLVENSNVFLCLCTLDVMCASDIRKKKFVLFTSKQLPVYRNTVCSVLSAQSEVKGPYF